MSKNTAAVIIVFVIIGAICAQIYFDLAERSYVRNIARNSVSTNGQIVQAFNAHSSALTEVANFLVAEFPDQVSDFSSKQKK